jgi:diguanylate cyclase (GGDEF)-like protein
MFRLTRTYSVASFFGIVLVTIALGIFYKTIAVRSLIEHETLSNVSLAQSISNNLWPVYADFVSRAATIASPELGRQPEIARLREDVLQKINGLRVVKVKIYNLEGLTVYSTEAKQIGEDKSQNTGFLKAKAGHTESDLVFRDHFSATEEIIVNRNLLSSYVPIRKTPHDPVEGVFEIYSDVTPLVAEIERTEYTVLGGVTVLLLLLYLFLFMIVRRADRIIKAHENEERKAQAEQIHYMAYHDPLTGLANRALFKDRLQHAVAVAARSQSPVGIMFIDIDRFKVINDSLGHEVGDAVLIEAAKRIRACLRASDTACRIGGDEFTVILEHLPSSEDAAQAATRLIQKFSEPLKVGGREIFATASIGISIYPGATHDVERLLKDANAAMHEAKESGRNRYVFYTQEMDARAQESLEYEMGLRKALQNSEFLVYYQPRVNTATGKVVGAEALLRWQHPSRGIITPDNFIPLLEDTGLVIPVGEWVLLQACRQCQGWHDAGYPSLSVSVNLSMKQFRSGSLLASVRSALEESGLPPRFLELELTETVLVDDVEQALDLMRELKDIGVSLSIDDFGTGYSSLNYLRRFPIDILKIDSSFIRDVVRNRGDAAITTTIAVMAKTLRLGILAEGVETREQARFLKTIGCHEMQGHLFGPAVPAGDFGAQLATLDVPKLAGFEPKPVLPPGSPAAA